MKIVIWLTLFCVVAICGAFTLRSEPRQEAPLITNNNKVVLEGRVVALEAKVKNLENWAQRRGSRY